MPTFTVQKSILVDAPAADVFAVVRDFKQWPAWSPWLIAEPDSQLSFADDGNQYAWSGKVTGSGEMQVVNEQPPRSIDYQLSFLKPWKSTSAVRFTFVEKEGRTEVTWTMDGSLPVIMFWMRRSMTAFIGMDYERGLMMLKQLIEEGRVLSSLDFPGIRQVAAINFVGIRRRCTTDTIGTVMAEDLHLLKEKSLSSSFEATATPLSIYHRWKPTTGEAEYTVALPIASPLEAPVPGLITGTIPSCPCYVVRHQGPYPQLGNAWSAGVMHARGKVFKQKRGIHPFETYENSPEEVSAEDLVTLVHFPAKT